MADLFILFGGFFSSLFRGSPAARVILCAHVLHNIYGYIHFYIIIFMYLFLYIELFGRMDYWSFIPNPH
jgi:hypothetical protein